MIARAPVSVSRTWLRAMSGESPEDFGPNELIRQAVQAEQAGFDFVEMSDHYHPWVEAQGHSAFTWSVLPVIAAKTKRIGLATGVTCPSVRYHPAIIAQAASRGVGVYGISHCYLTKPSRTGFIIGYSRMNEEPIREGIRLLSEVL